MLFETETSSVYEIDQENKRVRRLSGAKEATKRTGQDGIWKEYLSVSDPKVGDSVVICWAMDSEDGLLVMRTTITSPIMRFL